MLSSLNKEVCALVDEFLDIRNIFRYAFAGDLDSVKKKLKKKKCNKLKISLGGGEWVWEGVGGIYDHSG